MNNWERVVADIAASSTGDSKTRTSNHFSPTECTRGPVIKRSSEKARRASVDSDDAELEAVVLDFIELRPEDLPSQSLAKSMWNLAINDLRCIANRSSTKHSSGIDLFGTRHMADRDEIRFFDCAAWIYGVQRPNADEVYVSFDYVCDQLEIDAEVVRRVIPRVSRPHLKNMLKTIRDIAGDQFAEECCVVISEYVNLSDWRTLQ